jgi:hypothetical protein
MRKIFHNGPGRVSFGINSDGNEVKLALAFCGPNDQFTRKRANLILNKRLDHKGPSRSVFKMRSNDPMKVFKHFMRVVHEMGPRYDDSRDHVNALKYVARNFASSPMFT